MVAGGTGRQLRLNKERANRALVFLRESVFIARETRKEEFVRKSGKIIELLLIKCRVYDCGRIILFSVCGYLTLWEVCNQCNVKTELHKTDNYRWRAASSNILVR